MTLQSILNTFNNEVIFDWFQFRGTAGRVSAKQMDGEEKTEKLDDWAKKLDMGSLAIFPPIYLIVVLVFILSET